jgi:predicted O-methyltransferase YrrM
MDNDELFIRLNGIRGYLTQAECAALHMLARNAYGDILEIGSYKGLSTAAMALAGQTVYAIDPFETDQTEEYSDAIWHHNLDDFCENMRRVGVEHLARPIVGLSQDIAPKWNKPVNMLFIDGSHTYEGALHDFEAFWPWLTRKGIIAIHDVSPDKHWEGPRRVWAEHIWPIVGNPGMADTLAWGRKR